MDKRFNIIISDRAVEMLVQPARFLAQVNLKAADRYSCSRKCTAGISGAWFLACRSAFFPPTNTVNC
jgi:hypothetical protein